MTAFSVVIDALAQHGSKVVGVGDQRTAQCPAHEDRSPSLSVKAIEGMTLLHCHAGCDTADVVAALDLKPRDLFDDPQGITYKYDNGRTVHRSPEKRFRQAGTDNRPELYRLAAVLEAVANGTTIYLVEGEKDVHALEALGAVATTSPMGSSNWGKIDPSPLKGAHVIVVPDQDLEGQRYLDAVLASLDGLAASVALAKPADGKDAADHVAAGHGLDDLVPINIPPSLPAGVAAELAANPALRADVRELERRKRARELVTAIEEHRRPKPQPDAGTLAEILSRPQSAHWRIDGLLPASGRMLLSAMRKTGKTTASGNLHRSLLTGEPLFGRYDVTKLDGRIVALNYEVTGDTYARWMNDIGVPVDRLYIVNLRGRRNLLADQEGRDELVDIIRAAEGEVVTVDPFGRAYTGKSQNDTAEVTPWLVRLDEIAEQAGATELILTAHTGWDGERTRGSTALEDWPDVIVTMTRDPDTDARFIKAEGRDVQIDEDRLDYDPLTRRLTLSGAGSRKQVRASDHIEHLAETVRDIVTATPGINVSGIRTALRDRDEHLQRNDANAAAKLAETNDWIRRESGPKNSWRHFPTTTEAVVPRGTEQYPVPEVSGTDRYLSAGTTHTLTETASGTATPAGIGPCALCGNPTRKYGDNANPLCANCRATA